MRGRNGNKRVLIGLVCGLVLLGLVNHVVGGNVCPFSFLPLMGGGRCFAMVFGGEES